MEKLAVLAIVFMASVMAVWEWVDPIWAWWKTALTLLSCCVMVAGLLVLDRRLP